MPNSGRLHEAKLFHVFVERACNCMLIYRNCRGANVATLSMLADPVPAGIGQLGADDPCAPASRSPRLESGALFVPIWAPNFYARATTGGWAMSRHFISWKRPVSRASTPMRHDANGCSRSQKKDLLTVIMPFNAATGMISPRRPRGSMAGFARPMCRFKHCLSDQQSFSGRKGFSAAWRRFILNRRIPRQICAARDFSKIMKQKVVEFRREAGWAEFLRQPVRADRRGDLPYQVGRACSIAPI